MEKIICDEQWKPIPGYEEEYAISNQGRVMSLEFRNNIAKKKRNHIMKPTDNGNGYLVVSLKKNGKRKSAYIHRLVAEAFLIDKCGEYVNHKDYNKKNNKADNLEWCSQKHNVIHSSRRMRKQHKSKAGLTGEKYIYFNKLKNYVVRVNRKYIGTFKSLSGAKDARDKYLEQNDICAASTRLPR